jgi:hypothetical protein
MRNAAETTRSHLIIRFSAATLLAAAMAVGGQAFALSELRPSVEPQEPEPAQSRAILQAFEGTTLPQPGPATNRSAQAGDNKAPAAPAEPNAAKPAPADDKPAEIIRDMTKLPAPVKQMREKLVEAAASGDVTRLRALMGTGPTQTQVMNGEFEDPIETLKSFSGDADGQEILAIMLDILSTGAAHFDVGTADEAYVWPYFAGKQLSTLTPPERVDLLRIVTAGDLAGMEENGNYNFFRAGISPDGKWKFFSGGD